MSFFLYDIPENVKASGGTQSFCETYAYLGWHSCNTRIRKDFRKLQVLRPHLRHRPDCSPKDKLESRRSPPLPGQPAEKTEQLKKLPKYCQCRNEVL